MNDREQYKIMIEKDIDFVIDKIIEKNNQITTLESKVEDLQEENKILTKARYSIDRIELENRIEKVIKDLELTRNYNNEINNLLQIDAGHLNYWIRVLKGDEPIE